MGSQFNLEMSKYLDKRGNKSFSSENLFFKKFKSIPIVSELSYFYKKFKEKEQMVDIKSTSSVVVDRKSFLRRLADILFFTKSEELDVPINEVEKSIPNNMIKSIRTTNPENFFEAKIHAEKKEADKIEIQEKPDNFVGNILTNLSIKNKNRNNTFSDKEIKCAISTNESIDETCIEPVANNDKPSFNKVVLFKPQAKDDIKYILKVTHRLIKMAPRIAIEDFKKTDDYQKYVDLLRRYDLIEKK